MQPHRFQPRREHVCHGFRPARPGSATPIVLWDTASGARLQTLDGVLAPFTFRADGKVLYAFTEPRGVLAIEVATKRVLWRAESLPGELAFDIATSSDGSTVLVHRHGGNPRTDWLSRLDAATGLPSGAPRELPGLGALSRDGKTAAFTRVENAEQRVELQELSSGRKFISWRRRIERG